MPICRNPSSIDKELRGWLPYGSSRYGYHNKETTVPYLTFPEP